MASSSVLADCTPPTEAGRKSLFGKVWLWVLLITVLAGVLRTLLLTSQGLILDESFSVYLGRTPFANFVNMVWGSEFNMVLYYILLRLWMHFGHGEFIVRVLSVMFATATVPVIFLLGKRLFDERTGLIAALLFAVHPYHLMLAQRARSYPLLILLVSLASLCFVRGLQKPTRAIWMAYAVLSAAAVYSHFFAILVIAAQLFSLRFLWQRPLPWRMLFSSVTLLAVLLLPFAVFLLQNGDKSHVAWIPDLNLQHLLWVFYSITLSKARSLTYVALWCLAAWSAFRASSLDRRWPYQFTFSWLIVPLILTITASVVQPILVERFLSICIPAAVLLAAAGIIQLARWSRPVAFGFLLLVLLYSASAIRFYDRHPEFTEDWRGASAYVLQLVKPGDAVMVGGLAGMTFDYYRDISGANLPPFVRLDSVNAPLPDPPPQNVWLLGSTRFNPNWKGAAPGAAEAEVLGFADTHQRGYCPLPPHPLAGGATVWQFHRCYE